MSLPPYKRHTWSEYLDREAATGRKHELVHGQLTAMTGGTVAHALLVAAVAGELRNLVRGSGCRVHSSEQRLTPRDKERAYYPDFSVTCGPIPLHPHDPHGICDARLVGEVHSANSIRFDRGHKLYEYQELPSCQHVVFVFPQAVRVDVFAKQPAGEWVLTSYGPGDLVPLANDRQLSVDALYDGIPLDPGGQRWIDSGT